MKAATPETEKRVRETFDARQRVLGPEHPDTLRSMNHLAATLMQEGHYAEAEKLERQTLETRRRVLGPEHPDTLYSMTWLGTILDYEHKYAGQTSYSAKASISNAAFLAPNTRTHCVR